MESKYVYELRTENLCYIATFVLKLQLGIPLNPLINSIKNKGCDKYNEWYTQLSRRDKKEPFIFFLKEKEEKILSFAFIHRILSTFAEQTLTVSKQNFVETVCFNF